MLLFAAIADASLKIYATLASVENLKSNRLTGRPAILLVSYAANHSTPVNNSVLLN